MGKSRLAVQLTLSSGAHFTGDTCRAASTAVCPIRTGIHAGITAQGYPGWTHATITVVIF
jgi:hypothetical protein